MFPAWLKQKSVCTSTAFFWFLGKGSLLVRQDFFFSTSLYEVDFVVFKHTKLLHKTILHKQEGKIKYWNCATTAIQFLLLLEGLERLLDKGYPLRLLYLSPPQGWKATCTWIFRKFSVSTRHPSKRWNVNPETNCVKLWICWFILYNSSSFFYPIIWCWAVMQYAPSLPVSGSTTRHLLMIFFDIVHPSL